jgi:hypothetical protein
MRMLHVRPLQFDLHDIRQAPELMCLLRREIPEIPFAIYCALLFLSVVLNR